MAPDSTNTNLVPLNSKGRTYLAAIFDVLGTVTYKVGHKGDVIAKLSVLIPPELTAFYRSAYGGRATKDGWRVDGPAADRFAEEIRPFAPTKQPQLDLYLKGRRLVLGRKRVRRNGKWITAPLSEADKQRRANIEIQLRDLKRRTSPKPRAVMTIPAVFLRRAN